MMSWLFILNSVIFCSTNLTCMCVSVCECLLCQGVCGCSGASSALDGDNTGGQRWTDHSVSSCDRRLFVFFVVYEVDLIIQLLR